MKKIIVALAVCLVLLLGLCVALELRNPEPAPAEPVTYQVSFTVMGSSVSRQTVTEGELPETFSDVFYGVRMTGWINEAGETVDPFATPVTADAVYTAIAYPELSEHAAFLFTDDSGNLNPNDALTGKALSDALHALAAPGAADFFPALPADAEVLTTASLVDVLYAFYPAAAVDAAFSADTELTRSAFAVGMLELLCRTGETVAVDEGAVLPADVTADRVDAAVLLEASVPHTADPAGIQWETLELPTAYEPGFVNIDGWLYYVQEDGYFLRDSLLLPDGLPECRALSFGPDGRYTSGDPQLDEIVAFLLNEMILQNPDATRFELLRVAYDYCHQTFGYRRSWDDHPAKGSHGWEANRAKDIFTSQKGNCYGFAAAFWALSRGLGYHTQAVSGVVLADEQPHSWCFIEFDGMDYIFDPQWQFDYTRREIFEYDMFYLPSDDIYFWGYQWFE